MHENQGSSVIYYAHYTEDGVNKTGLTVTITVYEVIRDGTKTEIVSDGACTEIGDGLYRYLLASGSVDAAAEYVAVFHTATDTVDAQDIPAIWVIDRAGTEKLDNGVTLADDAITSAKFDESTAFPVKSEDTGATALARTGADSDTLETLSDQIDAIDSSGVAAAVWSNPDRTLTQTAMSITSSVTGSVITATRGDTWSIDITDLTLDSNKQQFVIKRYTGDADSAAMLFVDSDTGLLYLNGAAGTASDASLVYAGTTLTLTVKASATAQILAGNHHYGIQSVTAAGVVNEAYGGTFTVQSDIVKATA